MLCRTFGVYGPIASVKVIWPRTEQEKAMNHFTGQVCFMDRAHAEKAMRELEGADVNGAKVIFSWGKPVPLPEKPSYGKFSQPNKI